MKIEKLTNNTYRVRQQYKGRRYTVYFNHKPTQKEIMKAMTNQMDSQAPSHTIENGTFEEYANKYISLKEKQTKPSISPSTIRGYESILRNISTDLKNRNFFDIQSSDIQHEVNEYKRTHAVKSTKNLYGLIRAIFAEYRPDYLLVVKLPSGEAKAEYEPTTNDILMILDYIKGSDYSVAIQLAILGLRRGETCALEITDLSDDNVLTINKDLVADKYNNFIVKPPKTEASNRKILLPDKLADEIREYGYIYRKYPGSIARYLHKVQDKLNIPRFRFHTLRHFTAAYLHKQGFTDEQIMSWGGWSTSHVMKKAYRYNLDPAESKKEISDSMANLF